MASIRKLRRRLALWERYARRYSITVSAPEHLLDRSLPIAPMPGRWLAWWALQDEIDRRAQFGDARFVLLVCSCGCGNTWDEPVSTIAVRGGAL